MTPDEIRAHPLFAKLTDNQKKFVNALLANGNKKIPAAHAAWKCRNDEVARTLANRALKHEAIAYLVEQYFGVDPTREEFTRDAALAFLSSKARSDIDPKLALDYMKLFLSMKGWLIAPVKQDAPKPEVTDDSDEVFSIE